MAKNYKREGETIDFTAAAATAAGTLVLVGGVACVSLNDVAEDAVGVGHCEGVWQLPKAAATTATQGADAYVDAGGLVTGVDTANTRIGRFWEAATNGPEVALVKLNQP